MAAFNGLALVVFLISAMAIRCHGVDTRPFSALTANALIVTSTNAPVLMAGVDTITVSWTQNSSTPVGTDYKTVTVKLCYAPPSQVDRPWRKTVAGNIGKDKTCQFTIVTKPYAASNNTETYTVKKDVPGAIYFIRAYIYDTTGKAVAFGQTTNALKTTNLFTVVGITGRTTSIDVASGVFSAFSVLSLVYFFYAEKRAARMAT